MHTIKHLTAALSVLASASLSAHAQDLTHSAPPQDHPVFIVGATVHTISGETIENGVVAFTDGRLTMITDAKIMQTIRLSADTEVIDAKGMHVYPGLIASQTRLGLTEINAVRATLDHNEVGDVTPEVRAAVSVNPDSTLIPVARTGGILTFASFPTGGRVPGRASVMASDGWTWEDMALDDAAGLVLNWPSVRPSDGPYDSRSKSDRMDTIRKNLRDIDELFDAAQSYADARAADSSAPMDLRYEAMLEVMPGAGDAQEPVFISASDVDQINSAVTWATGRGLRPVIVGGRDAPLCADLLKTHDVPVIVNGTHGFPKRADSPFDDPFTLPMRLQDAGIRWCLNTADRDGNVRNLPHEAGRAVAFGLDHADALASITLWPAEILGVGDQIGSLEQGKLATIILTDGDVLELTSNVHRAWIGGGEIDLSNKQTELRDKYRVKYKQLDIIKPEGTNGQAHP